MTAAVVILAVVAVILAIAVILALRRPHDAPDTTRLEQRLDSLGQSLGQVVQQANSSQQTVGDVRQRLGQLTEATQRILEVGKDMRQLQEVLSAPKLRGGLGERMLGELLSQALPQGRYEMQKTLRNGQRVDAVISLSQGLVPVDAKFPLEAFRRLMAAESDDERRPFHKEFRDAVKRHVDNIAEKYICPGETMDFALMYIPAENVYYEMLTSKDEQTPALLDYAWQRRVIPTSPSTFYVYLQTIALGLQGLQVERNARTILDSLARLRADFDKFAQDYKVVGTHLRNAKERYDEATPKLDSLVRALPGASTAAEAHGPQPDETAPPAGADSEGWSYSPAQSGRGRRRKGVDLPE